jgi:hypothetical protein
VTRNVNRPLTSERRTAYSTTHQLRLNCTTKLSPGGKFGRLRRCVIVLPVTQYSIVKPWGLFGPYSTMSFPDNAYVVSLLIIVWLNWQSQVASDSVQLPDPLGSLEKVWQVLSAKVVPVTALKQTSPMAKDSTSVKDSLLLTVGAA